MSRYAKDIARFLDKHFEAKPNASNKYRALLSVMFTFAVRKGLLNANPVSEVAGASEKKRDRYITDAELDAIRAEMTAHYTKAREVEHVKPVPMKRSG